MAWLALKHTNGGGSEFPFNEDNLFFLPFRHVAHQRRLVTDAPTHFPALGLVEMEMICMSCIIVGRQGGRKQAAHAVPDCVKKGSSEEHTSELQSLMRCSYADFCLKKKTIHI